MRIPGIKSAKLVSRWAQARLLGGALILGYHRITNVTRDEYDICVGPQHFAEHMDILSRFANVVHIHDLVQLLMEGTVPPKTIAVTFDDGYADNLHQAKPILEKYSVPATVFVCTEYLGKNFWWDELSWLINYPASLPEYLHLDLPGKAFDWHSSGSDRTKLITYLHRHLYPLETTDREAALAKIREWTSAPPFDTSGQRVLTPDELLQLANPDLIDIGSHTHSHAVLPMLPIEKQKEEMVGSRKSLEQILGRKIEGISYPNGTYNGQTPALVQETGYLYACTSDSGLARNTSSIYQLPRFWPKDWDGEQFRKFLQKWIPL